MADYIDNFYNTERRHTNSLVDHRSQRDRIMAELLPRPLHPPAGRVDGGAGDVGGVRG